ncbi:unnamed protein product [Echinostoma caproni]|uniref:TUG-UBL1 domain-containing protein n=1 Tax=Echinostoma caproni TaxID=27848 RepID=A0A183B1E8_9TREM|nr:unnamed protein product [Echinostoma caproni]
MPFLLIQYPSGHRANIEIQPNTTLRKVLELACEKRALDCSKYSLTYNRRPVDLSTFFRFSGLVNRATLDLVPLNDEESRRMNESTTQIVGETKLRTTLLRDLGVSSGSVLLQLHHCSPADLPPQPPSPPPQKLLVGQEKQSIESCSLSPPTAPTTLQAVDSEPKRPRTGDSAQEHSLTPLPRLLIDEREEHQVIPDISQSYRTDGQNGSTNAMLTNQTDPNDFPIWSVFATPPQVSMFDHKPDKEQQRVSETPQTLGEILGIGLTLERGPLPGPTESPYVFQNFSFPSESETMDIQDDRGVHSPRCFTAHNPGSLSAVGIKYDRRKQ